MTLSLTTQGRSIWDVQDKDASTASGGEDTRNQGKARRMGRMFNYFFLLLNVAHRAQQEDENDGKRASGFKVMRRYDEESRKYWNNMLSVRSSEFDFKKQVSVIDSPRYKKVLKEIRSEDSKAAQARQQDADKRKAEAAARAGKGAGKGKDARRDDVPRVPLRDPVPQRDPPPRRDDREPREPAVLTGKRDREAPKGPVCWNWSQKGECKFGEECRFSHDVEPGSMPSKRHRASRGVKDE